jgi:hypothetical protein
MPTSVSRISTAAVPRKAGILVAQSGASSNVPPALRADETLSPSSVGLDCLPRTCKTSVESPILVSVEAHRGPRIVDLCEPLTLDFAWTGSTLVA